MKIFRVAALLIAVLSSGCTPPPGGQSSPVSEQPPPDTLVVLFAPNQKEVPPFNNMARMFDVAIPASEYDSIRRLYFDTFVEPYIESKYDVSATRGEFNRLTERPSARGVKRTGLTSEGARWLVNCFAGLAGGEHFTVGSSKDDVLRVQGTPDELSESMWRYGSSRVFFAKDRVTRWNVFPLSPLKVKILPSSNSESNLRLSESNLRFSVGSSKDEVLFAQGPPNAFSERSWRYGDSVVFFEDGRVTRWQQSPQHPLRVQQP